MIGIAILVLTLGVGGSLFYEYTKDHFFAFGLDVGHERGKEEGLAEGDSIGFERGFNTKYEDLQQIEDVFKGMSQQFKPQVEQVEIVNAVAAIGSKDSKRAEAELQEILEQMDRDMLNYLSENFNLSAADKEAILAQYQAVGADLNREAVAEMVELGERNQVVNSTTIFTRQHYDGVRKFDEILSNKTCGFLSFFNSYLVEGTPASLFVKATTKEVCPYLLNHAINPLVVELKERAIIQDYAESKTRIEREISSKIIQLATAEFSSSSSTQKTFTKEIDWGITESTHTATIDITANSTTKAGFDLSKQFGLTIDHGTQRILIELPEPQILSHEVNMQTRNVDDSSWMIELDADDFNLARAELESRLRERAEASSLRRDAINNAKQVLGVIFSPVSTSMPTPYSVEIKIGDQSAERIIDYSKLHPEFQSLNQPE